MIKGCPGAYEGMNKFSGTKVNDFSGMLGGTL